MSVRAIVPAAIAILITAGTATAAPRVAPQDLASPSFTWGAIPRSRGNAGLDGTYGALLLDQFTDTKTLRPVTSADRHYFTFFPDGRYYSRRPPEGLENFNYDYWKAQDPSFCGTYTFSGDSGQLYDGPKRTVRELRKVRGGLLIDKKGPYGLMDRCDGLKLEGTFRREGWQTLMSATSRGAFISFTADGRFEERDLFDLITVTWWRPKGHLHAESGSGKGTYSIANNSLTLLYQDGRKRRVDFWLDDGVNRSRPDAFIINAWKIVRVK
jgi:hypothetical protein